MRRHSVIFTFIILSVLFFACGNRHGISVKVTETDDEFKFSAEFPENKSDDVMRVISRSTEEDIFGEESINKNVPVSLEDGTTFVLRSEPGEVLIRSSKRENSPESLSKIRDICNDIKKVLAD